VFGTYDGGAVSTQVNIQASGVFALVPQGDGGYANFADTSTNPSSVEIDGVPLGTDYLFEEGTSLNETTERTLDLGSAFAGRPDATQVSNFDNVNVNLTNLLPISSFSQSIETFAFNDGVGNFDIQNYLITLDGGFVSLGDTALQGFIDWSTFNELGSTGFTVDPTKGDTLFVGELSSFDGGDNGATIDQPLARFIDLTGATIDTSGNSSLSGALVDVPRTIPLSISIPRSVSTDTDFTSGVTYQSSYVDLGVLPEVDVYGFYAGFPDLIIETSSVTGSQQPYAVDTTYGNPYPVEWPVFGLVHVGYTESLVVDPGVGGTYQPLLGYERDDLAAALPAIYTPALSPVRNIMVNGQSAGTDLTGVTTTPTISWTAPAQGTPTAYYVILTSLIYDPNSQFVTAQTALFTTLLPTTTSFTVPPGVLDNQSKWYFLVEAVSLPNTDLTKAPFRLSLPAEYAINATHLISP
jgi:hypothetical protein